jgi:hypothetical protein
VAPDKEIDQAAEEGHAREDGGAKALQGEVAHDRIIAAKRWLENRKAEGTLGWGPCVLFVALQTEKADVILP